MSERLTDEYGFLIDLEGQIKKEQTGNYTKGQIESTLLRLAAYEGIGTVEYFKAAKEAQAKDYMDMRKFQAKFIEADSELQAYKQAEQERRWVELPKCEKCVHNLSDDKYKCLNCQPKVTMSNFEPAEGENVE